MFKGRLGLETARVPYVDRHGLIWLGRGNLFVENGCLTFVTAGGVNDMEAGTYHIPYQGVSVVLLGPGGTISHDALRILARHGTGLVAVGEDGVRFYASMPFGPDRSALARRQVELWSSPTERVEVAREMFALRFGSIPPQRDMNALRGIEGARVKEVYRRLGEQFGVEWSGRRYDRQDPEAADAINRAINHVSTAVYAAAMIAVSATSTIPQLGFVHEDSARAFGLDIADIYRTSVTLPIAFEAVSLNKRRPGEKLERTARRLAGQKMQTRKLIPEMIDTIKELLGDDDDRGDA